MKGPTINLKKRRLEFQSNGVGAQGSHNYGFSLDFYSDIDTEVILMIQYLRTCVEFCLIL